MYDFHWSSAKYMNPSQATIPIIRPHQCDSEGGRIRGVLLYVLMWCSVLNNEINDLDFQGRHRDTQWTQHRKAFGDS